MLKYSEIESWWQTQIRS